MFLIRHRVAVRPHDRPAYLFAPAGYALPYLPGGCPADFGDWPQRDGVYTGPHRSSVCPTCLPTHRELAEVSDPFTVPAQHPLIYFLGPTRTAPDTQDHAGGNPDLLHLLSTVGFTRAGWLPLPGLDDTFVFDHPTDHTRVILHAAGMAFHLFEPDTGRPFHILAGPRVDDVITRAALDAGGYTLPRTPDASPTLTPPAGVPTPPPGARLLTPNEAAHLIATGDHPAEQHGSVPIDAILIALLRDGQIRAAQFPDGRLTFAPTPDIT